MMRLSVISYRLSVIGCLVFVLLLFSCREQVEQPTLPDEKISRIMADLFTAEAATNGLSGYTKDSLLQVYFKQVMEMHHVTKEEYEKNLRLLTNDLPRMEGIIKQAETLLSTGGKSGGKKELNTE
jgi:hypothetical protein